MNTSKRPIPNMDISFVRNQSRHTPMSNAEMRVGSQKIQELSAQLHRGLNRQFLSLDKVQDVVVSHINQHVRNES